MRRVSDPKRRDHIRPRNATEAVCVLVGLSKAAEGSRTSRVTADIGCVACRVGADRMQEAGDLLVSAEGRWLVDERPVEFRSVWAFVEYLGEEERRTFTLPELQELVEVSGAAYRETLAELRRLGFRLERPEPEAEVRGIGRLKKAPRDAP